MNTNLVYISWPIIITSLNLVSHLLVLLTVLELHRNRWFMHISRLAMAMLVLVRTKTELYNLLLPFNDDDIAYLTYKVQR